MTCQHLKRWSEIKPTIILWFWYLPVSPIMMYLNKNAYDIFTLSLLLLCFDGLNSVLASWTENSS
jgi:hypothetical protein